ncbi:MAG: hypothetical protein WA484_11275 [Solirubrobacteraceae bacterium]
MTKYLGVEGSGNGQFNAPSGIAVNEATGDLFVADSGNNRIEELTPEGAYVNQFNGGPEHRLADPTDIAIDNSTSPAKGDVYVYDRGHKAVDVFDGEGKYLRQLPATFEDEKHELSLEGDGIAIDSSGNVWVSDVWNETEKEKTAAEFNDAGNAVGLIREENFQRGIAIDTLGNIYVQTGGGIRKYNAKLEELEGLNKHGVGGQSFATGLAAAPATGNIFIDEGPEIAECAPFGEPGLCEVDIFGALEGMSDSRGIAVGASGTVFASEYAADRIAVFKVMTVPVAGTGAATVVERRSATVLGTIRRGEKPATYHLQYGEGGSLASSTQPVGIPGEAEEDVQIGLTELKAATTYSYRLVMEAEGGIHYYGNVETFETLPAVEGVGTGPALSVTARSAMLTGALEPNGFDAHYYFRYGESAGYGRFGPVLPGTDATNVSKSVPAETEVTKLIPNTTYHFSLVATNELGLTEAQDETFTTLPVEPVAVIQPALLVGLHEATLSALVNPEHSETHYHFLFGTTASYGTSLPAEEESDAGSSYGNQPVAMPLEGLASGATYHYAVVASNSQGTVQSEDMTFTTPTIAQLVPAVTTGTAGEVSSNGASISGMVDPRGLPTSYEFDIGTDTTYGSRVFGEAGSRASTQSLTLQGLAAGTLYHYRLVAVNKYGTVYGSDETFTTPGFLTALLASPVGAPLVPAPAFTPPSTRGAVTVKIAPKPRKHKIAKRKAKQKRKRGGGRAGKASHSHGNRGNGR